MDGVPEKYEYGEEMCNRERIEYMEAHLRILDERVHDLEILVDGLFDRLDKKV